MKAKEMLPYQAHLLRHSMLDRSLIQPNLFMVLEPYDGAESLAI